MERPRAVGKATIKESAGGLTAADVQALQQQPRAYEYTVGANLGAVQSTSIPIVTTAGTSMPMYVSQPQWQTTSFTANQLLSNAV